VLVDEAQDLTPMQWRMLARRGPAGSMTLVGDFGQASRPGACSNWDEVLAQLPERYPPRLGALTVNYRTPTEIMDLAHRVLAVAAPWVPPTESVRETGNHPTFESVARGDLLDAAEHATRAARTRRGKVAVLAPDSVRPALIERLADLGAVGGTVEALDAPVAVLDATDSKGLEFDHVVIVEPAQLVNPDEAGLKLLFVALTRATQTLAIVHAEPLPPGLAHPVGV
jgi:DNA helicase IV